MDSPASRKPGRPSARETALSGWKSKLSMVTSLGLLFLGLTGLYNYIGHFSTASQLSILAHALIGTLLVLPILLYIVDHVKSWWRQKMTGAMFFGYVLLLAVGISVVSGLVVAWQAIWRTKMNPTWDIVHLLTGLCVLVLVLTHVVAAARRRRPASQRDPELRRAMNQFGVRAAVSTIAAGAGLLVMASLWPTGPGSRPIPEDYTLPEYSQNFEEYRGNPFAPTFARTSDRLLVDSELLAGSESCGSSGCHSEVLAEWQPSAHRFAAMNQPFQAVQRQFALDREPAETRYCAGCHDPISLFAGAKDTSNLDLSAPGVDEGISCVGCHSISQVDQRGNADYVLTPPRKYLGENSTGLPKAIADFLIRAHPRQHLADYDRNLLRTPEFCGTCHKQFIPEALNRFGLVPGQNQYDEWKNGHWHTEDPSTDLSCRDCHMRLVFDSSDPGHGEDGDTRRSPEDKAHRHHGFIATNNFMPEVLGLEGWEEQTRLTNEWIRGETVLPEIAALWPEGPIAGLQLRAPEEVVPGGSLELRAIVVNRKAGHNFITGPLDFVRSWIHLRATDNEGNLLAEWGAIDPDTRRISDQGGTPHQIGNNRDEGTLVLESIPIDAEGNEIRRHELWKKAGGRGKRVIFPNYSDTHLFRLQVPSDAQGDITFVAELNYRRYRQEFLDLVVPELESSTGVLQPTVTQTRATQTVRIATVAPGE